LIAAFLGVAQAVLCSLWWAEAERRPAQPYRLGITHVGWASAHQNSSPSINETVGNIIASDIHIRLVRFLH
jgi:hypothetical protein